jgi:hypothetical protein
MAAIVKEAEAAATFSELLSVRKRLKQQQQEDAIVGAISISGFWMPMSRTRLRTLYTY